MYSDEWINDKSIIKSPANKVNDFTNISFWQNACGELVGVSVSFELAEDVHYEFKADAWRLLLKVVLNLTESEDYLLALNELIGKDETSYHFAMALFLNNIEHNKLSFN